MFCDALLIQSEWDCIGEKISATALIRLVSECLRRFGTSGVSINVYSINVYRSSVVCADVGWRRLSHRLDGFEFPIFVSVFYGAKFWDVFLMSSIVYKFNIPGEPICSYNLANVIGEVIEDFLVNRSIAYSDWHTFGYAI